MSSGYGRDGYPNTTEAWNEFHAEREREVAAQHRKESEDQAKKTIELLERQNELLEKLLAQGIKNPLV